MEKRKVFFLSLLGTKAMVSVSDMTCLLVTLLAEMWTRAAWKGLGTQWF